MKVRFNKLLLAVVAAAAMITGGCDIKDQDISNTLAKANHDVLDEAADFDQRVRTTGAKANHDTNNALSTLEGQIIGEKDKLKDRLVGSTDKQLEAIEQVNVQQEMSIEDLYEQLDDLQLFLLAELDGLKAVDASLADDIEQLQMDLDATNQLIDETADQLSDDIQAAVRKLKRKIRRVARADDYCSIQESSYIIGQFHGCQVRKVKTKLHCPNGSYTLDSDIEINCI